MFCMTHPALYHLLAELPAAAAMPAFVVLACVAAACVRRVVEVLR